MSMSRSEAGKLGYIASKFTQQEILKQRIRSYYLSPKKCKFCKEVILYEKRHNKYCNHSCAAKNRLGYTYKKQKINCLFCGNITKNPKFCSRLCSFEYKKQQNFRKIQDGGSASSKLIKKYLINKNGHICNKCNLTTWNNEPITLEIEHKDGNSENNNLNNLEILCPNCHAQTPTYKAKNMGNGRYKRSLRYKNGKSY